MTLRETPVGPLKNISVFFPEGSGPHCHVLFVFMPIPSDQMRYYGTNT